MKTFSCILLISLGVSFSSMGQFLEFGGGLGAMSYAGDLSRGYKPFKSKPGAFGLFRMNFSEFVSFRTALTYGTLTGSDSNPIDPLGEVRGHSFRTSVWEFS